MAAVLVGAAMCAGAQTPRAAQPSKIHVTGCVQKGVEAGCLMLRAAKTGKLYQLLIRGLRPEAGLAIEIVGSPFRGLTNCIQGRPIFVGKWSRSSALLCSAHPPGRPSAER